MKTVYPIGTTIYDPERCWKGYTLLSFYAMAGSSSVMIIDMNGTAVHEWPMGVLREPRLLPNGNILVARVTRDETRKPPLHRVRVQEYDWAGQLVWDLEPPELAMVAEANGGLCGGLLADRLENGNTLAVHKEPVPWEYMRRISEHKRRNRSDYNADCIREVTPAGETVWEWKSFEHIDMNLYLGIDESQNWTHFNSVQVLPENKWYDSGDVRFKPGSLLLSPRTLGFIFIIDRKTGEIAWRSDAKIALTGQHAPRMIGKGLPGEGNILVYDNGVPPLAEVYQVGKTRVLEINPLTFQVPWSYDNGYRFFNPFTGNAERLPNGNTLVCESFGGRLFEVTMEGEIVWECVFGPEHLAIDTAYRLPYDYCPQLAALPIPEAVPVVPPPHAVVHPRHIRRGDHHFDAQEGNS